MVSHIAYAEYGVTTFVVSDAVATTNVVTTYPAPSRWSTTSLCVKIKSVPPRRVIARCLSLTLDRNRTPAPRPGGTRYMHPCLRASSPRPHRHALPCIATHCQHWYAMVPRRSRYDRRGTPGGCPSCPARSPLAIRTTLRSNAPSPRRLNAPTLERSDA